LLFSTTDLGTSQPPYWAVETWDLVALLKPFTDKLDTLGINYNMVSNQYNSYYSQKLVLVKYQTLMAPASTIAGRLAWKVSMES
jgi:hypothetical protein